MPAFQKACLLFNPVSGSRLDRRASIMQRVAEIFRRAGIEVEIESTQASGAAGEQARAAIGRACDAIFACGGDGTVFDVLQGVAQTNAAMGVIPLGTGNVLAHDLGLPDDPERAASQLLDFRPQHIALGRIDSMGRSRFFTVAAGVGVHAELVYRATAGAKEMGGYLAYYTHGAKLLLGHPFVPFPVEITTTDGAVIETTALELLAIRVRSFGGPLRRWHAGSSLLSPELRLCLLRDASRARIVGYTLRAMAGKAPFHGLDSPNACFSFVSARSVVCHSPQERAAELRVQADGELLGQTPAAISIVPQALNLLLPGAPGSSADPL